MNVRGVVTNMDLLINLRTIQNQYSLKNYEKNHGNKITDKHTQMTTKMCINIQTLSV